MPYPIKSTAGTSTLPVLRKNNYGLIGVNQGGYGSTSSTGFWNGKTPNVGGYIVYVGNGTSSPTMYVLSNSVQLIPLANDLGAGGVGSVVDSLYYFILATNIICINFDVPNIVTNGLIVYYDAGFTPSYPGAYTTWYDLSGNGNNGFLINGPTYSSDGGGSLIFDGSDDYANVSLPGALSYTTITICGFIKWLSFGSDMFLGMSLYDVWTAGNCLGYNNANGNVVGIDAATVTSLGLLGNWKHYTFVMNSSGLLSNNKIYIDGVSVGALTPVVGGDGTIPGFSTNLRLCDWNEGGYYGNLQYGNLQVYNRELTQSEILQNYYAGLQKLIPTDNLVLWLDGQNTNTRVITPTIALDTSVNNYNGNFINAASLAHREAGTSFYFDGVDDRITNNGTLPSFSLGLTIDMLIKPAVLSANTFTFILQMCSQSTYVGYLNQGTVGFSLEINGAQFAINSLISTPPSVFSRITLTYDNSNVRLYKNGVLLTTIPISGVLTNTASPIPGGVFYSLGSSHSGSSPFKGIVSTFRVYNRALTSTEISNIYNANIPRYS